MFLVRAHPDELRPGKASQEPVGEWMQARQYTQLPNVVFIPPTEYVSSYDLARLSRFCLVYNSTIGLEAVLLGTPVITGGKTRYHSARATHAPASSTEYLQLVTTFLNGEVLPVSEECRQRARRYMYYSQFRAALSMSDFIEPLRGYHYGVKPFTAQSLHPDKSTEMGIIYEGIVNGRPFCYP